MIATVVSGVFMTAMHFLSKAIPANEYGQFGALLSVAMFMLRRVARTWAGEGG